MKHKTRQGETLKPETVYQIFSRLSAGFTERETAASLGISRSTIIKYKRLLRFSGIGIAEAVQMSEHALFETLRSFCSDSVGNGCNPSLRGNNKAKVLPDFNHIALELHSQKGVSLEILWQEYLECTDIGKAYSYSHFCELFRRHTQSRKVTLRRLIPAGERVFVDFGGLKIPYVDKATLTRKESEVFVGVLGFSNLIYVHACESQTRQDVVAELVRMFTFMKGSPKAVVVDNLKAVVDRPCRYDPAINPMLELLAQHYNTSIVAAAPRSPTHKAKVEVGVQIVQRFIQARLRKQVFTSIFEINQEIAKLLPGLNAKTMRTWQKSRQELYEEFEEGKLNPLPQIPFAMEDMKSCRVGHDYHFEYKRSYYSVPYHLIGKIVSVRRGKNTLQAFYQGESVAVHCVAKSAGEVHTLPQHRPVQHQTVLSWPMEKLLEYAHFIGPCAKAMARALMEKSPYPELASRAILARLHFYKSYGRQALEESLLSLSRFHNGLLYRIPRVREISNYLKRHYTPAKVMKEISPDLNRDNLRGTSYYSNLFKASVEEPARASEVKHV